MSVEKDGTEALAMAEMRNELEEVEGDKSNGNLISEIGDGKRQNSRKSKKRKVRKNKIDNDPTNGENGTFSSNPNTTPDTTQTQTDPTGENPNRTQDTKQTQTAPADKVGCGKTFGCRGMYILLAVKLVVMVATAVFMSTNVDISKVKPCELETALNSINFDTATHLCKNNAIKKESSIRSNCSVSWLSLNSVLFAVLTCAILCAHFKICRMRDILKIIISVIMIIIYLLVIGIGIYISVTAYTYYCQVVKEGEEQQNTDFIQVQTEMVSMLERQFSSDNISATDVVSRDWNIFFIQYDCCAVREVQGTTNDFDKTPWCTTNGTCQSTSSQIPKSCCKDVTQYDYQNAPDLCHASVNPGTYKPSCISRIRALNAINIDESLLATLRSSLFVIVVFQIMEAGLAMILLVTTIVHCCRLDCFCKQKNKAQSSPSQP